MSLNRADQPATSARRDGKSTRRRSAKRDECGVITATDAELDDMLKDLKLTNMVSHLLRCAHFRAEEIFSNTVGDLSVTPRQKALLIAAYRNPGANQAALAEMIALDPNSLAEMATRMVRDGHLRRTRAPLDARARCLHITQRGIKLLKQVMPFESLIEEKLLSQVPARHRPVFVECLQRMVGIENPNTGYRSDPSINN